MRIIFQRCLYGNVCYNLNELAFVKSKSLHHKFECDTRA